MKIYNLEKHTLTQKMVMSGIFAALTVVITYLSFPITSGGYIHLGDTAIFTGLYAIGGVWGIFAGALGSALTDLILGYAIYIPATFVIKALMAFFASLMLARMNKKLRIVAFLVPCLIVPLGYFLFEIPINGGVAAALPGIPFNLLQGVLSAILAYLLTLALDKTGIIKK